MRKICFMAALLFASMTANGLAQGNYPLRSIQIIVPFTAGGGNDLLARVLAEKLQKRWGQPVIVDNKHLSSLTLIPPSTKMGCSGFSRSGPVHPVSSR
jgi:tripartite-type tricarboxylate transporter receptor subunit TctC